MHPLIAALPSDLTPPALRHVLADDIRVGRVIWVRLDGLTIAEPRSHAALQSAIHRMGLRGDEGAPTPELVVFEWTHVTAISADGLSFVAVLCQALLQRGIAIHCLPAEDPAVAAALAHPACAVLREPGIGWHPGQSAPLTASAPCIPIGKVQLFAGRHGSNLTSALDEIAESLERGLWPAVPELDALLMETAQNVFTHARAENAALSVVVQRRRRPSRLQVGVADDGVGIPIAVLDEPRHGWLASCSPSRATEAVLTRRLTGRGVEKGGGVLGELYASLVAQAGATITLRSREGWVQVFGVDDVRHQSLTFGVGTQLLVELPLVDR